MSLSNSKIHVAIVADSAASIPDEYQSHPLLSIVPMRLTLDGQSYMDGRDITPTDFYRKLRSFTGVATTSAPSLASYKEAFEKASKLADAVICITVSALYSSASEAASSAAKDMPDLPIRIVDSQSAGGGEGLILLEALRAAESGLTPDAVEMRTDTVIQNTRLVAMLDTLHYLWKGGRVPRLAAAGTSLLNIKPVFELRLGDAQSLSRPRTRRRAIDRLLEYVEENSSAKPIHVCVMNADCIDDAQDIYARIDASFDCSEIYISQLTPVMGAHIGPGMLGIAFWSE